MAKRQDASTGKIVDDGQATEAIKKGGQQTMHVKVHSPFQSYFDELAYSISAVNKTGPFDILPKHYNFLTLLIPCTLDIRTPRGNRTIKISRGVMHVKADKVVVFLDV
jgi:F0F1-type ATP synthase epsilon subunit